MSKLAGRAALLAARLPHRDVPGPELGDGMVVRVQQMSVSTRQQFLERFRLYRVAVNAYEDDQDKPADERENLAKPDDLDDGLLAIVMSAVDEDGERLFTEEDMPVFNGWAQTAVQRLYDEVLDLNDYNRLASVALSAEKKG